MYPEYYYKILDFQKIFISEALGSLENKTTTFTTSNLLDKPEQELQLSILVKHNTWHNKNITFRG